MGSGSSWRARIQGCAALALALALAGCNPALSPVAADCGSKDCGACAKCGDAGLASDCGACVTCKDAGKPSDCGACKAGDCGACPTCADAAPCKDATVVKCADAKICPDMTPALPAWPLQIGGTMADHGHGARVDGQGKLYITGMFRATTHVGPKSQNKVISSKGAQDRYLAKVDQNGKVLWTLTIGTKNNDSLNALAVDPKGNSYIAGRFKSSLLIGTKKVISSGSHDIYVAKVNTSGVVQWAISAGGAESDNIWGVALDGSANLYLAGAFAKTATFGTKTVKPTTTYPYEMLVAKLDTTGPTWSWVTAFGGGKLRSRQIAVDSWGNIFIAGIFNKAVTIAGTTLTPKNPKYGYDLFWLRLNSAGSPSKAVSAGGTNLDAVTGLAVDSTGNTYMLGHFRGKSIFGSTTLTATGDYDVFVTKLDPSGKFIWATRAGGSYIDHAGGISLSPKSTVLITGSFKHLATFGGVKLLAAKDPAMAIGSIDSFTAELSASSGSFLNASSAGGPSKDYGSGVAVDSKGTRYVTGRFTGQASFGKAKLTSRGDYDGYVWRLP